MCIHQIQITRSVLGQKANKKKSERKEKPVDKKQPSLHHIKNRFSESPGNVCHNSLRLSE